MKYITKTSEQAKIDRLNNNTDNICPECEYPNLGIELTKFSFFKIKRMEKYTCFKCGCEWNTGWKEV